MLGTVKWFNNDKGYGFIVPNDGSSDVFVHYTAIEQKGKGRRSLEEGQEVEFDSHDTPKGRSAIRVSTSVTRAG